MNEVLDKIYLISSNVNFWYIDYKIKVSAIMRIILKQFIEGNNGKKDLRRKDRNVALMRYKPVVKAGGTITFDMKLSLKKANMLGYRKYSEWRYQ